MKIVFTIVGTVEQHPNVSVDLPIVPQVGDTVELPGVPAEASIVRTVVWHPLGDSEAINPVYHSPFVYIVLGQRRPA